MTVVVITQQFDPTADYVITRLADRGAHVVRFDLSEIPQRCTITARLTGSRVDWTGTLRTAHRTLDLSEVRSVWYRKPHSFRMPDGMSEDDRAWAEGEAKAGFGGLLSALRCRWINHPHRNAAASLKPHQLTVAAECGLTIPNTVITNNPDEARSFVSQHPGAIYKAFRAGPRDENGQTMTLYTNTVTSDEITDSVQHTMHLFQERVPKDYEVRLTVVGHRMFGLRIDATTKAGRQDWRADHINLEYSAVEVPGHVAHSVHQFMATFGLTFGALDFIVTPVGQWVFLEVNPNGQWAWPNPVRDRIADALTTELIEGVS